MSPVLKVLDSLLEKSHSGYSADWSLVESLSELQMGNHNYTNAVFICVASENLQNLLLQPPKELAELLSGPSCLLLSSSTVVNIVVPGVLRLSDYTDLHLYTYTLPLFPALE